MAKEIEEAMEKTIETINDQFSPDGELMATSMPELPIQSTNQILDKLLLLHRYGRPKEGMLQGRARLWSDRSITHPIIYPARSTRRTRP